MSLAVRDIKYLALQGGGGRGIVYLGVIRALEDLGILMDFDALVKSDPHVWDEINKDPLGFHQKHQKLKGISGSSSGAFVALLISLGYSADAIDLFIINSNFSITQPQCAYFINTPELGNYVDFNDEGWYRMVDGNSGGLQTRVSYTAGHKRTDIYGTLEKLDSLAKKARAAHSLLLLGGITGVSIFALTRGKVNKLKVPIQSLKEEFYSLLSNNGLSDHVIKCIDANPRINFNSFWYDGGLFSGINLRNYINHLILLSYLHFKYPSLKISSYPQKEKKPKDKYSNDINPLNYLSPWARVNGLSFIQFFEFFKMDLRVTGTNITQGKHFIFSKDSSPDFPVADAVAISMSYPGFYKPVLVHNRKDKFGEKLDGLWVDGGVLNNLPIHAFDAKPDGLMNRNMLGFRLIDRAQAQNRPPIGFDKLSKVIDEYNLMKHSSNIIKTLFYPSDEGQIRTRFEKKQVIPISSENLKLLDFTADKVDYEPIADAAKEQVLKYFNVVGKACNDELEDLYDAWGDNSDKFEKEFENSVRNRAKKYFDYVSPGEATLGIGSSLFKIDIIAQKGNDIYLIEVKSSETAPFSRNQSWAIGDIAEGKADLRSTFNGKFSLGTPIPKQKLLVIRPANYCYSNWYDLWQEFQKMSYENLICNERWIFKPVPPWVEKIKKKCMKAL